MDLWFYTENDLTINVRAYVYTWSTARTKETHAGAISLQCCNYRFVACLLEGLNSSCNRPLRDFRGTGRCKGQVRRGR